MMDAERRAILLREEEERHARILSAIEEREKWERSEARRWRIRRALTWIGAGTVIYLLVRGVILLVRLASG